MKRNTAGVLWAFMPWGVALGIHSVLLFTPWSRSDRVAPPASASGRVRVVDSSSAAPNGAKPDLQPLPQTSSSALVVAKRRPPAPAAPPPPPPKAPVKSSPPASPVTQTQRSPQVAPRPPKPRPTPQKPQPPIKPNDLVVNLAQLPDTQPCQQVDGCWKSQKSQWRAVYTKVQEQITAQGYRVTELDLEDDTGFRVSQIAKNGQTKYFLHLLSTLEGTIYILNPTQLSKQEVEQRVTPPPQMG